MGRREELLRIGAAVLILGVLVFLFLRDRAPDALPRVDDPGHTVTTPTEVPGVTGQAEGSPGQAEPEAVPSPPVGLAELVCEQFRQPVELRVLSFNTHRSTGTSVQPTSLSGATRMNLRRLPCHQHPAWQRTTGVITHDPEIREQTCKQILYLGKHLDI